MDRLIENIAASEVSRILAERHIPADKPVTVLIDETMADIARRTRLNARAKGITEEIFADLMRDVKK